MLTIYDFRESTFTAERPLIVACGVFDGVHRGHQSLLRRAVELAAASGGRAVALSFNPHPRVILTPANAPAMLSTIPLRLQLFAETGLDGCVMLNFDQAMSALPPADFLNFLLAKFPRIRGLVVGRDWRFGRRQEGDTAMLRILAAQHNLQLTVMPPVIYGGENISSTRIRTALAAGNLDTAAAMLGRPFTVVGTVIAGRQIGRLLNAPTANLLPGGKNPLPPGSYAAETVIDGTVYPSSVYAGSRPTYQNDPGGYYVEDHILDQNFDLYGREIAVRFLCKIRDEMKFANEDALRVRIAEDFRAARAYFTASAPAAEMPNLSSAAL